MLRNYLTIAWRNLLRHKVFSLINILGLAIGMAACLLILQYVSYELSYDSFHTNGKDIYRIKQKTFQAGKLTSSSAKTDPGIGLAMKATFPEILEVSRAANWLGGVVSAVSSDGQPVAFNEPNVFFVDAAFLSVFSFPLLQGSASALNDPNALILTESMAKKYFGKQDPIGKSMKLENHNQGHHYTATVRGVCRNGPSNSHLQFDFLVSRNTPGEGGGPASWTAYTYVLLSSMADSQTLENKLYGLVEKSFAMEQKNANVKTVFSLQPISAIHLYSNLEDEVRGSGNGKIVWFLTLLALLILLIAYVNYVNLSTAKAMERAKEVGIRKVLGSRRLHLIKQFFLESLLLNLLGILLAITWVQILMPLFSQLSGVAIGFTLWKNSWFWPTLFTFLMLGTFLSGLYPALFLSSYQPVQVLKGQLRATNKGIVLRKALVVFQFAASIALIVGTFTVYQQVNYMRKKDLGMNMAQTLIVAAPQTRRENEKEELAFYQKNTTFKTELLRYPGITSITSASNIPGVALDWTPRYFRTANAPDEEAVYRPTMAIGSEFIDQFQIKIIAGKKFYPAQDKILAMREISPIMLNEAAVQAFEFKNPQAAIGQVVFTRNAKGKNFPYEIVGVMQNFHQSSLKDTYTPLIFQISDEPGAITHYALKVNTQDLSPTIARIETTYKSLFPGSPFEYFFLDEFFNQQYKADQHFGQVFGLFAGLAIFVACLGLFGLISLFTMQRTKEIGVRKVLGASVANILLLLSKDYIRLVMLANLLAWPLAYWGISQWLDNYAFRISISPWLFILPTLLVLLIALLTVSFQTWKAARQNPVKALRYE